MAMTLVVVSIADGRLFLKVEAAQRVCLHGTIYLCPCSPATHHTHEPGSYADYSADNYYGYDGDFDDDFDWESNYDDDSYYDFGSYGGGDLDSAYNNFGGYGAGSYGADADGYGGYYDQYGYYGRSGRAAPCLCVIRMRNGKRSGACGCSSAWRPYCRRLRPATAKTMFLVPCHAQATTTPTTTSTTGERWHGLCTCSHRLIRAVWSG
eukprot:364446-Chlamydomonas_euryale.AAC.7